MKPSHLLLFICCLITSCQTPKIEFGVANDYFPPSGELKKGIVNKHYVHFKSNDGYDSSTDISYTCYQLLESNLLNISQFDAAYALTSERNFRFENDAMLQKSEIAVTRGDTAEVQIFENEILNWAVPKARFHKRQRFPNFERNIQSEQTGIRDTTVMDLPAKIFTSKFDSYFVFRGDTTKRDMIMEAIYVKKFGLHSYRSTRKDGTFESELVEQMPLSEFEKRAAHNIKRVAYINPDKVMDEGSGFEICGKYSQIFDYYNGNPDGHFIGGKGGLWKAILPKLEKEKITGQSGYLTFRFIINCEGKIGNFITEQADLDFQKTKFSAKTVNHFFGIMRTLTKWQPCHIQKVPRDSYAYLTFKLRDGELVELLP